MPLRVLWACHLIHAQMLMAAAAALAERNSSEVSSCGAALHKKEAVSCKFSPPFEVKLCSYLVFTV